MKIPKRFILYGCAVLILIAFIYYQNYLFSVQHRPKTAYDYYRLGKELDMNNKLTEAENTYAKAIALDPSLGKAYVGIGVVYTRKADYYRAEEYTLKALKLCAGKDRQNEEVANFNLGTIYVELEDVEKAWEYYKRAYEMKSAIGQERWQDDPVKFIYYVMHNDRKKFISKVNEDSEVPAEVLNLKRRLIFTRSDKAIPELRSYIERYQDKKFIYIMVEALVKHLIKKKNFDDAYKVLDKVQAKQSQPDVRYHLAYQYYVVALANQDHERCLKFLDNLKKEFPERFSPLNYAYERALVYKDMGKRMEEKKALLEVLALTSAEKEYYGRRTTTASFLQLSYYRYANNRLLEIDLLNADYAAASRRYVSQKSLNYILGIAILGFLFPALFTGIFFIIFRIFFLKKEQDVRSSLYRLRHLFLFGVIVFLTPPLLYHILLTSNYIFAFLTFFKTHPLLLTELLAQLIIVVAVTYIYKRILHKTNDELGIRLNALKPILKISLSLALFFVALNIGILKILDYFSIKPTQTLFEKMFKELLGDKQPGTQVVMYANIILFAPIAEELRFRLFLNDYIRKYTNIIFAVIVSSAFFALGHGLGFVFIHFFIMGIVLSVIYFKYKSVLPCIATHMFYNFFIILIWLLNEIYKIF